MKSITRIGVLTGGGDCPGLNAVIRAVAKTGMELGVEVVGILNGFNGLIHNEMIPLAGSAISGILHRGGTILGTTNRDNPFAFQVKENGAAVTKDMSPAAMANLKARGIDGLVVIGGDGTLKIASEFSHQYHFPVITVPKTIDNDIPCTERTFGFDTAVHVATEALDRLHTTAESHHRAMVLEVMGRYAGWIALHAGLAGGADCILIPEIPFCIAAVIDKINERIAQGKHFSLIVVAEGAMPVNGSMTVAHIVEGSPEKIRLGGIGEKVARQIEELTQIESRATVLGHVQRGGTPTAFDRVLATRYGVAAVRELLAGSAQHMVALQKNAIVPIPIDAVAGTVSNVPPDSELIAVGRSVGVCFGE